MNRYRFPMALLVLSALTFGLFITARPAPDAQAAPRSIPWDCSDWQETPAVADAEDARVSMILESLAANRGKSIYCAIDQSDTWTKSETWLAGRDRNERDDTVYFGEQGNFRGFLAAQEGYLTDGESGVTGVSRELIFEFPEEPRRGKKTVIKRLKLAASPDRQARTLAGNTSGNQINLPTARTNARNAFNPGAGWTWTSVTGESRIPNEPSDWLIYTREAAERDCAAAGYPIVREFESIVPGSPVYGYIEQYNAGTGSWAARAYQIRQYTATCGKKVRVRRR